MESRTCQNCKKEFVIDTEDFSFYQKMNVPPPTFCPHCRFQRRIAFRNERKLFRVKDAFTGENIFSLYPIESHRKVVTQEGWHGDSWDPASFGREYDFSKPFLIQLLELEKEVPIYNLNVKLMVNSPYSGNATALKNCYLCFNSNNSEDCLYGNAVDQSRDCIDNSNVNHSERCYEGFWLQNCYQCYFTSMSVDCRNMWFSRDCLGCSDCFGCTNLRKSSYCIFNKQYDKETYLKEIEKMNLGTTEGLARAEKTVHEFWNTQPTKCHQGLKNMNSTGSYVTNCKNVNDSYLVRESENMRYCQNMLVPGNKDCYDVCIWGENTELSYETSISGESSYNLKFCFNCWPACSNSEYCMNMFSSSDCFGCVGMKKAKYCILNKQYTKEEYELLVPKIKEHMNEMPYVDANGSIYRYGEFFPIEFSPFGYNNTQAQEYFPLTQTEALAKGYSWIEVPQGKYEVTDNADILRKDIKEISEKILKEVIACNTCSNVYRIMPEELRFLKNEGLAIPQSCPDCRHTKRASQRLKETLHQRDCMCAGTHDATGQYKNTASHRHGDTICKEQFKTGYSPTSKTIVYCEQCYQQEVT